MPGRQQHTGVDLRRAAAVLLLAAIAAVGLRAGGAFPAVRSPGVLRAVGNFLYWTVVAAGSALAVFDLIVIAVWLLWARGGGDMPLRLPRRRRRSLLWLLILPLEVYALAKVVAIIAHSRAAAAREAARAGHAPGHPHATHLFLPPASSWPLLGGLLLAAVAAVALMAPRRRARTREAAPEPGPGQAAAPLLAAVTAGTGALRRDSDPRAAIVNCYAAMENSLAEAGSPPAAADTPAEVLARASTEGLLRSPAAGTLAGLFRRARYSTHPVTEADRSAAQDALGQIRAELGEPA
jgi:Domain of unknown function (DUF4129)